MLVFWILWIGVVALNLYFIYRLNSGEIFLSLSETGDGEILNQKRAVQKVNEEFEAKTSALADFSVLPPISIDPSI